LVRANISFKVSGLLVPTQVSEPRVGGPPSWPASTGPWLSKTVPNSSI
jgi:hypothetical protein